MSAPGTRASSVTVPFLVATLSIAGFSCMDAMMKELSTLLGAYNAMLWRTPFAISITLFGLLWRGRHWPNGAVLKLHVLRGVIVTIMGFLFFWGLTRVPLAEAIALSFVAPLIALYLAAVLLHEQVGREAVLASLLGFVGVLVIVWGRLGAEYEREVVLGIVAILLSALLYAYNLILQRRQSLVASPIEIAFFQNLTVAVLLLLVAPLFASPPPMAELPALALAAMLSVGSLMLVAWAYARAEARLLIPVEYSAFIWAAILGWLFFNETVTWLTVAGTGLIVAGCLIAARQEPRQAAHSETTAL